jgi:rhamnosyltransferase subunit B
MHAHATPCLASQLGTTKQVVLTTWGCFGDVHPFMAFARELQERGYISVIATSPFTGRKLKLKESVFHPVRPDI